MSLLSIKSDRPIPANRHLPADPSRKQPAVQPDHQLLKMIYILKHQNATLHKRNNSLREQVASHDQTVCELTEEHREMKVTIDQQARTICRLQDQNLELRKKYTHIHDTFHDWKRTFYSPPLESGVTLRSN